jgi:hypothetical protein
MHNEKPFFAVVLERNRKLNLSALVEFQRFREKNFFSLSESSTHLFFSYS